MALRLSLHVMRELNAETQPEGDAPPSPEALAELRAEIDALMALPPRAMPDIIVVGDDDVAAIYLPPPPA